MKSLLIFLCFATPALADQNIGGKTVDCYCTDREGNRVDLGQTICLQVDGRMFMAQCQMSLNVPMWREVAQGCYSSSLTRSKGPQPTIDPRFVHPRI